MSALSVKPPRGTRDFYPEDLRLRDWLFEHFHHVARRFGFEQVDAPVVEHAELFTRKAGEEIVEQLYHFTMHDRHLALRGEITPSIARMVMARAGGLRMPLRWYSIPQCWRYERMTRGRRREHYQWNMDIWGEPGPDAEAELIAAVCMALERMGLGPADVRIRISSRALVEETLRRDVLRRRPEVFEPLCVMVDKIPKLGADAVVELLSDADGPVALEPPAARQVVELLSAQDLDEIAGAAAPDSAAVAELRQLFDLLGAYGLADWIRFDASVVRGLAYYTGVVFEAFDAAGALRSVCGGGRYDRLLESLGGPAVPAVGFGFGDAVILELLAEKGLVPDLPRELDDVVYAFGTAERPAAAQLAMRLRRDGRRVELVLGRPKLKRAMADADRAGAARIWLLGPDELGRGVAKVRDLATGEERDEKLGD
ncbi:MAG: histidine--tRNA ligase [Proteobacteria bacterium]|nr:histidine--tRNA ligase [Pseudomonadota bacterium]